MRARYWETFPRFLHALEQLPNTENSSASLKAWGFYVLSRLQVDFNIGAETLGYINQSVMLFRQVGNRMGLAQALALRCYIIFRQIHVFPPDPAFCEEDALRDKQECLFIVHELSMAPNNEIQNELAWVNCWVGAGEFFRRNFTESKFFSERSQAKFKQSGDWIGELYGWGIRLYASVIPGCGPELLPDIDNALELASRINHKWYQSHFNLMKAKIYYSMGKHLEFEVNVKQCFILSQQVGNIRQQNKLSIMLGDYYTTRQDYPNALFYLHHALNQLYREEKYKDLYLILEALSVLATLALQTEQIQHSVQLLGFIELRLGGYSIKFEDINLNKFEESRGKVRKALDEGKFQTGWNQGRAMTMDEAVALALEIR